MHTGRTNGLSIILCFIPGGIILGNYLTEKAEVARTKLLATMLVSVCYDTHEGCKSLEKPGLNLMLNRHLASCLVDSIKEVKHQFESTDTWDLDQVFSSRTIREFDARLVVCHRAPGSFFII